jgi:DNA-binding NarL/FixJ family response regulator
MTGPALTLLLADDHGIIREGIAAFLKSRPDITILGQCPDGEQALTMILATRPDFAIIDLQMRRLGGLDLVRRVRQTDCPTKLIVLATSRDEAVVRQLFRSGADGYVLKDGPARHLLDAIGVIREGGQYLTPLLRRETGDENDEAVDPVAALSKRECEVFRLLVDGMRPKDIAKKLDISPKTVDTYRANIMRKLGLDGIAALVRFAILRNLSQPLFCVEQMRADPISGVTRPAGAP